jgi:hypothetical protein
LFDIYDIQNKLTWMIYSCCLIFFQGNGHGCTCTYRQLSRDGRTGDGATAPGNTLSLANDGTWKRLSKCGPSTHSYKKLFVAGRASSVWPACSLNF